MRENSHAVADIPYQAITRAKAESLSDHGRFVEDSRIELTLVRSVSPKDTAGERDKWVLKRPGESNFLLSSWSLRPSDTKMKTTSRARRCPILPTSRRDTLA